MLTKLMQEWARKLNVEVVEADMTEDQWGESRTLYLTVITSNIPELVKKLEDLRKGCNCLQCQAGIDCCGNEFCDGGRILYKEGRLIRVAVYWRKNY